MPVVSLQGFRPIARFDATPWTQGRVEESADGLAGWAALGTFNLSPLDADPADPQPRNFTVTNATLAAGYYRVVFVDAASNESASPAVFSGPTAADGYPSRSSLVAESTVDELLDLDGSRQDVLRASAIAAVEEHTGQRFVPTTGERVLDGEGGGTLYLDRRLATLTTLEVSRSALTASDVVVSEKRDRLHVRADLGGLNYYEKTLLDLNDEALAFTKGEGTITITGVWGWLTDEFPAAVAEAIRLDMEDQALAEVNQLREPLGAMQQLGVRRINQGGVALDRATVAMTTVSPRVKRLLDPYVWTTRRSYAA